MKNERELYMYMAHVYDQTDRHQETIDLITKAINLDPKLSIDEINLLSSSYKTIVTKHRNAIKTLEAISKYHDESANEEIIGEYDHIESMVVNDLVNICNNFIKTIDETLIPYETDIDAILFYYKLKADYLRYICEARKNDDEIKDKCRETYEFAVHYAKENVPKYKPSFLGLMLNYSIFLVDVLGNKEKGIEIAQNAYDESLPFIDHNINDSFNEATMIIIMMNENIQKWKSLQ